MKRDAILEDVELVPQGEFRMGAEAYGLVIQTNFGAIDSFRETPIMIGHEDYTMIIEQSSCTRYLLIKASFATYMVDIKDQAISVFTALVRGPDNAWSRENAVYGQQTRHIQGFSRHYHIQFPFVGKDRFQQVFDDYKAMRRRQMEEAREAV